MVTGTVTFDFLSPVNGRAPSVTPYVVVGGGLFRTREQFPFSETFISSDGVFTAGGGFRAAVGKYVSVGVDARLGRELFARISGVVGVRLGT